jgi:argininosuccinate lyase
MDEMPLGSGACAGTTVPVDREALARDLGFARATKNSIDAVSDRDFVVELHAAAALLMTHLSRLAEEMVVGSTEEFGYYRVAEPYTTGSSLLPQKRNPDGAELVRGKSGRVVGNLVQMLVVLKGLPLAYNKDMQEDKEGLFDTLDTLRGSIRVMAGMIGGLRLVEARAKKACAGVLLAADLADYLTEKGVPFREAHRLAGLAVKRSEESGIALVELPLADLKAISPLIENDVRARLTPEASIAARDVVGGTAPGRVAAALAEARRRIGS